MAHCFLIPGVCILALMLTDCASEPARPDDNRSMLDDMMPRSGDPARPNVKVEVIVADARRSSSLRVDTSLAAGVVRGMVDVRAALSGGAGDGESRTETRSFILVQTGNTGSITLSDDARYLTGGYTGMEVRVLRVGPDGVELELAPYASMTSVRGETLRGATHVTVPPGQAAVIGGVDTQREERGSGIGAYRSGEMSRQTMVLLVVTVVG